jgi:hypothetical protein
MGLLGERGFIAGGLLGGGADDLAHAPDRDTNAEALGHAFVDGLAAGLARTDETRHLEPALEGGQGLAEIVEGGVEALERFSVGAHGVLEGGYAYGCLI